MSAYPSAEIRPALDETRPTIGPNLAGNQALCEKVASYIHREHGWPQLMQQQRLWPTWDRIDDALRVRNKRLDLDISITDPMARNKNPDGRGDGITDRRDGASAKVSPAAFHRQVRSKTDMHMSIAWADGMPVRAMKPETVYEHPLYNPTSQCVDSSNELLRQCADEIQLKTRDRELRGSWSKVGHGYVHLDFKYRLVDEPQSYSLPPDPHAAMALVQTVAPMFGGQPPQWGTGQMGERLAIWTKRTVDPDSMITSFDVLRYDAVFLDQTLPARPMEMQPCPMICSHVTRNALFGNDYEPQMNPFGWMNCRRALGKGQDQYTLANEFEGNFQKEMAKKHGMDGTSSLKPRHTIKQLWTCYPMLAIDPENGMLDEGEGLECPTCKGAKQVQAQPPEALPGDNSNSEMSPPVMYETCPKCEGEGRVYIEPQRYVVQMFGILTSGASSCTVLRIQRNPTVKDKVPLIFGAHLTEDTAGAIPMSVSEASLQANDQLATAHNQFLDAKNSAINPAWKVQRDEFEAMAMDLNRPNRNIALDNVGNAIPAERPTLDATTTLIPYINMQEGEVQAIHGLPPVLLGQVSSGRRAATEIQTSSDAARLPITVEVDSCNHQFHGVWAQFHLWNIEAYADRDWIQRKTGRTTFGKVQLFTAVGEEFFQKQAKLQLLQNFLPAAVGIQGANIARMGQAIFELAGFDDVSEFFDDGGQRKAQMDCLEIIAQILGEGIPVMPAPSDPHAVYIAMFEEALKSKYWRERTPENLPLLQQRLQIQQYMQTEAMMAQMQQQMAMQAMTGMGPDGKPAQNGQRPPNGSNIPQNATQSRQQSAGRSAPQRK